MIYYVKAEGVSHDRQSVTIDQQLMIEETRIKEIRRRHGLDRFAALDVIVKSILTFQHDLRKVTVNSINL